MKNIKVLLQDALDVCEDLNIEVRSIISINWNTRLKSVWGRCIRMWVIDHYVYKIEVNSILGEDFISWEDAMNTVIHEVLHCHEDRFCHTGEWKRCAELVNREYTIYHISRCTAASEKGIAAEMIHREVKYEVRCLACNGVSRYRRAGDVVQSMRINPHSCTCGRCGSHNLKLIER